MKVDISIRRNVIPKDIKKGNYPTYNVDGIMINPNAYDPKTAAGVYSVLNIMHESDGVLDVAFETRETIIETIQNGCNGLGTPSFNEVLKKFPDPVTNYLSQIEFKKVSTEDTIEDDIEKITYN